MLRQRLSETKASVNVVVAANEANTTRSNAQVALLLLRVWTVVILSVFVGEVRLFVCCGLWRTEYF